MIFTSVCYTDPHEEEYMHTHLSKRGSTYYFRRKTPVNLVHIYGKEIVKSLGTKDLKEAVVAVRKLGTFYDSEFALHAAKPSESPRPEVVTESNQLPKKASLKPYANLEIDDAEAYAFLFLKQLRAQREQAISTGAWLQFNYALDNLIGDAEEYIRTGSHPFEDSPKPMWKLEAELIAAKSLRENKALPFTESMLKVSKPEPARGSGATNHSLEKLVAKWANERSPRPRTVSKMYRVIGRFTQITKVSSVTSLTKKTCVEFKDGLLSEGMSSANVNQYLTELNTLLNYATKQAVIDSNPASGLKVIIKELARDKRLPFDLPALKLIFTSPIYSNSERPLGGRGEAAYWLPLLALFTGARLNELCQLNTDDIFEDSYLDDDNKQVTLWAMLVTNEGEGQELKNERSRRRIPLHSELIRLGFVKYINGLKNGLVFPELSKAGAYGSLSANWSKWFGRYLRNTIMVTEKRMVFHSFRHSFKDYARAASIPSEVHNALTGHSSGNVADNYGSDRYPLKPLAEAMAKYKVTGLVLPVSTIT